MGEKTGISWCDATFNPWWGCVKVSPGCTNCYAETWAKRMGQDGLWGPRSGRRVFDTRHWDEPLKWDRKAEKDGVRRRVFCGSMCDIFEEAAIDLGSQREQLWSLIEATPSLDWLLLTKRPENIQRMLPERWSLYGHWAQTGETTGHPALERIWMGTTTENQAMLYRRWPVLESASHLFPFRNIWISVEPMLSEVDLSFFIDELVEHEEDTTRWMRGIDWVVAGCESGKSARPMQEEWARSLRDQCQESGVPFFLKQMMVSGKLIKEPFLDGVSWNEFPG